MEYKKHRLLSADEEIDLAMRVEAGDQAARAALVEHNLGLVHKIARKYWTNDAAVSFDDFVQEGALGLLQAVDKFDWRRGVRFSTYAYFWINQRVERCMRAASTIHIPYNVTAKHLADPAVQRARTVLSLDQPFESGRGEGGTLADIIPDDADSVEQQALRRVLLAEARAALPEQWRPIFDNLAAGCLKRDAGALAGYSHCMANFVEQRARRHFAHRAGQGGES